LARIGSHDVPADVPDPIDLSALFGGGEVDSSEIEIRPLLLEVPQKVTLPTADVEDRRALWNGCGNAIEQRGIRVVEPPAVGNLVVVLTVGLVRVRDVDRTQGAAPWGGSARRR
jgi:hypothetical protein